MSFRYGTYTPLECKLIVNISFLQAINVPARIESIDLFAGAAVGSATVSFPTKYAEPGSVSAGDTARIKIGVNTVFRGTVGSAPFRVSPGDDMLTLVLYDDKWRMRRMVIGEPDIGSMGSGWEKYFGDVGQDIVFNADGRPNRKAGELEFSTGSSAEYWTIKTALQMVFEYWIDSDINLYTGGLDLVYDRIPSDVDMRSLTALEAVDQLFSLAGDTWAARPSASGSSVRKCRPGTGTTRRLVAFAPKGRGRATQATRFAVEDMDINLTVLNNRDVHDAASGPAVIDSTYTTAGPDPLLARAAAFENKQFAARYAVSVDKYSANGLGPDLSVGSRPKAWLPVLATRLESDGSGYLTAAQIAASPGLEGNDRAEIYVWLAVGSSDLADAMLVTGGVEIDYEFCLVDFEASVEVLNSAGEKAELEISDWSAVNIWVSCCTVLRTAEHYIAGSGNKYLKEQHVKLIDMAHLTPEKRVDLYLPDLSSSDANATTQEVGATEEDYIDVSDRLEDAALSSLAAMPATEIAMRVSMPFLPVLNIGDRLNILRRDTDATGDEIAVRIRYNAVDARTQVQATNVTGGIDPDNFIQEEY